MGIRTRIRLALGLVKEDALPTGVTLGRHSYGVVRSGVFKASPAAPLTVGAFCSIADAVMFLCDANHSLNAVTTFPVHKLILKQGDRDFNPTRRVGITVGNDVWIGRGALIMPGVSIGDGAIVGGGSVVTKDVAPFSVVAGNPARFVRHRVEPALAASLSEIAWWNWPDEKIVAEADALAGPVEAFVERHRSTLADGHV